MTAALIAGAAGLAIGTFGFRFAGPMLRRRMTFPPRVAQLLEIGSVVLLIALAVTTLVPVDHRARFALPAGVLVAAILAWRKAPLVVVALAAASATALLRLAGVA
ncbi:AzlD domain-containing protein [Nocardia vaccinii]|uniref:AzlD domain-containing protein n=1 Tax=Nocardia vaccinii TaxID=1822 RepID=UPI0008342B79|nr:AzlD domain-containing protein [Nocardia vaccinii]